MNHDPVRFCLECRRPKPRDGFRALGHGGHGQPVRMACADCYAKISAKRAKVQKGRA